jgi:single-stranded-DNA-specific exonuclease
MVDKNRYSIGDNPTPMGVAFYVAPFVNAAVRSGTQDEKELIFQSMLKFKAFKKIPSNKRGHKPGEMEQLYIQAIRTATNVKNRQTRAQEAGLKFLEAKIEKENLLDDKVLLFLLMPGDIDRNIAGLVANKFMAKYQRPCCILTRVEEENGRISYQGSARGCDKTGVSNFKEICEQTECIIFAEGHQGAFGLGIELGCISEFLDKTNKILKDTSDEAIYYVDYIYKGKEVNEQHILDIANLNELWGKDIDEPFIAIQNLKILSGMITLMSPDNKPTLKITLPNGVSLIKFNSSEEEYNKLLPPKEGCVELNIIGRCNKNEWAGRISPQVYIEDYEIIDKIKYVF